MPAPALPPATQPVTEAPVGMPISCQKSDSSEMDSDLSPSSRLSDLSRGGSLESRSSSSRSRSFTLDDESLKYLTHEEKDVILFFEETLDSLEDDFEEPVLCDSGIHCHSPQSLEESPSSHSEPEDVIDLVQPGPTAGETEGLPDVPQVAEAGPVEEEDAVLEGRNPGTESLPGPDPAVAEALPLPPTQHRRELSLPVAPPAEHPRLPRSVPTPLVIAQKISEKLAGSEALSPTSPSKEARPGDWRTLASLAPRNGDHFPWPRPAAQPTPKVPRFPSNISVTNSSGKDFNKTISRAAVNVQERKAQVLANISGVPLPAAGDAEAWPPKAESTEQRRVAPSPAARQSRAVQTEAPALANGFASAHEALRSEASPLGCSGKSLAFRPEPAQGRLARHSASRSLYEPRPPGPGQDARPRAGSLPRAGGLRPQGITVQFSGRGSTEAARREALRKLGLLKETP